jgi:hypothetical protein
MTSQLINRIRRMIAHESVCVAAACLMLACAACRADSVNIVLPGSVTFIVTDITQSTPGLPSPCTISYSDYVPGTGSKLRIGLQAQTADFVRPTEDGSAIPSLNLSWTGGLPVNGGVTDSGQLLYADVGQVYEGTAASNTFDVTFVLAPLDPGVRAGSHTLTATWRVESF